MTSADFSNGHTRATTPAVRCSRSGSSAKSKPHGSPSDFAVTGVYFYDDSVWRVLPELKPSGRGELEITDVNNWYLDHAQLEYDVLGGFWGDAGESIQAYYAVGDFVRANGANKES